MSWVVAGATLGSAAIGYAGNKAAASKYGTSADAANQVEWDIYNSQRQDLAPYRDVGRSALDAYATAMGLPVSSTTNQYGRSTDPSQTYQYSEGGPVNEYEVVQAYQEFLGRRPTDKELKYYSGRSRGDQLYYDVVQPGMTNQAPQQSFIGGSKTNPSTGRYGGFEASPGYQFTLDETMKAAERAASAGGYLPTGGGTSGRFSKELSRYGKGLASTEFDNYLKHLGVLSGTGQAATNTTAQAGANLASGVSRNTLSAGEARASGILGSTREIQGGINDLVGYGAYKGLI